MDLTDTVYAPPKAKTPWRLEALYAPAAVRLYGYGRHALAAAFELAGARGKSVLLPEFICRDVLASVAAVGAQPVFYPVTPELTPAAPPERWPRAACVLAVDYFGFPQDLAPFEKYGKPVIEDAAHALLSRDGKGRLLGTRAPLGALSPRKSLPLPNGGALLASGEYAARLPPPLPTATAPGRRAALKGAARPFLALAGSRMTLAALTALRALRGDASGHVPPDPGSERALPSPAGPCPELAAPVECADPAIELSRRRALWALCRGIAHGAGLEPVFPALPEGVNPYAYAFRAPDLGAARETFARAGLGVLPWPDLPEAVAANAPAHYRDVALAHFLW